MPASSKVVVFGEALVDQFSDRAVVGGAPLNVARHLAGFGLTPLLVTRIGEDENGGRVLAALHRFGMPTRGVQVDPAWPTGVVLVDETAAGHRFSILPRQAWDRVDADAALAAVAEFGRDVAAVCYGTLALRSARSAATWSSLLGAVDGLRLCDMNWRAGEVSIATSAEAVGLADEIKVSREELDLLAAHHDAGRTDRAADAVVGGVDATIARLLAPMRAGQIVVTLGADGYVAFARNGECLARGSARRLERVVDTVGAGDAFTAVLVAGRIAGWPLVERLDRANAFAAQACTWRGAVPADDGVYAGWRARWGLPS